MGSNLVLMTITSQDIHCQASTEYLDPVSECCYHRRNSQVSLGRFQQAKLFFRQQDPIFRVYRPFWIPDQLLVSNKSIEVKEVFPDYKCKEHGDAVTCSWFGVFCYSLDIPCCCTS